MSTTCDRDDSILCQPASKLGHKEPLLCCSAGFLSSSGSSIRGCPKLCSDKKKCSFACFLSGINYCSAFIIPLEFLLFILVFIAFSFYASYKRFSVCKLQLSSLSLPQSELLDMAHASASQVNNFGCGVGLDSPSCWSNMWRFVWDI